MRELDILKEVIVLDVMSIFGDGDIFRTWCKVFVPQESLRRQTNLTTLATIISPYFQVNLPFANVWTQKFF